MARRPSGRTICFPTDVQSGVGEECHLRSKTREIASTFSIVCTACARLCRSLPRSSPAPADKPRGFAWRTVDCWRRCGVCNASMPAGTRFAS